MPALRALIVDDEPLARERLRTLLAARPDVEVVDECRDGPEAVDAVRRIRPDLLFLDVQMPGCDGFEVLRRLAPEERPAVLFVTAYDQHALRAFEVHALDYLLKPFAVARFTEAVDRAVAQLHDGEAVRLRRQLAALLAEREAAQPLDRLMIKDRGRLYFLRTEEIDYVEAAGNYLRLHAGGRTHLLRQTMTAFEDQLDPAHFLRIHRSSIVNLNRVRELTPRFNGEYEVTLDDGTRLTLSRTYRDRLDRFGP